MLRELEEIGKSTYSWNKALSQTKDPEYLHRYAGNVLDIEETPHTREKALTLLLQAASLDYAPAMKEAADILLGESGIRNKKRGIRILIEAVKQHKHLDSCVRLFRHYMNEAAERNIKRSTDLSLMWLEIFGILLKEDKNPSSNHESVRKKKELFWSRWGNTHYNRRAKEYAQNFIKRQGWENSA